MSILSMNKPMLSLKEICTRIEFNPSTTYRMFLSAIYKNTNHLTQINPNVDGILDTFDETASFFIEEDNHRICLYRAHSFDKIRHNIDPGTRLELNRAVGVSGRTILAYGQRKNDPSGFF